MVQILTRDELISMAQGQSEYDRRDADVEAISSIEEAIEWFKSVGDNVKKIGVNKYSYTQS